MKFCCQTCGKEIEYDEGEGNLEDGYTCYECILKSLRQKNNNLFRDTNWGGRDPLLKEVSNLSLIFKNGK